MTQEELSGTGEPTLSEAVEADTEEAQPAAAPPLNRAERRAQAKGKKGGSAAFNAALPHNQSTRGSGGRGSGVAGQVSLPRTGHK